jgi:hypothetical protein
VAQTEPAAASSVLERLPVSRWHWRLVMLVGLGTPCPHPEALSPCTDPPGSIHAHPRIGDGSFVRGGPLSGLGVRYIAWYRKDVEENS